MQERKKSSTDELHKKIRRRVFFVLRVAQAKKAKDLFSGKLHTRAHTWKPLSPPGHRCRRRRHRCVCTVNSTYVAISV